VQAEARQVKEKSGSQFRVNRESFSSGEKNSVMYWRQISVRYELYGQLVACPMKWLDNFSMRSFTNDSIFDDTLPIDDGLMKIGTRVPLDKLKEAMEDWFRRKSYIAKEQELIVEEKI
jgi:hypothetical protein